MRIVIAFVKVNYNFRRICGAVLIRPRNDGPLLQQTVIIAFTILAGYSH